MSYTFNIADLHGRIDLLEIALLKIRSASPGGGTIIFTGDYIDRGPWGRQVLDKLMQLQEELGPSWTVIILKGNHEDMFVAAMDDNGDLETWLANGGGETARSFNNDISSAYIEWCRQLPLMYQDEHRVYVHAGVDPTKDLVDQSEYFMLWNSKYGNADIFHPEAYIVHGHIPVETGPVILEGRANFDTKAFKTGRLVVGVFKDDKPGGPVGYLDVLGKTGEQVAEELAEARLYSGAARRVGR